ncbi:MAG: aspartate--tRNA ligase [Chthoniobacterales bacterium]
MKYRTHTCGDLRATDAGTQATLSGWIATRRDHGGVIFLDLRDRNGLTQIVFRPEENADVAQAAHALRTEDVIQVTGRIEKRLTGTENSKLPTGDIELVATQLNVLNKAEPVPFPLDQRIQNEDLRLEYRYLDLRRTEMVRNLTLRHRIGQTTRAYLDKHGYLEIETPLLTKSTPEGAREFLVPSRIFPGNFYALSQSPQQYKQLLMVAGIEKYFQIAKCFRDEDPRADRITELTQIDLESSFITPEDIFSLIEGLLKEIFKATCGVDLPTPFKRLTYQDAMDNYGSDKPDLRFGVELRDLSDVFRESQFKVFRGALDNGGCVKAINAKGFACITTGQIEELTELAKQYGAKGLAFIKIENGEWKSPIVKFFSDAEKAAISERMKIEEGDLILFGADQWQTVCEVLGRIRLRVAEIQSLTKDKEGFEILWVIDFPLLAFSAEENKWNAVHHPFTRPKTEDMALLEAGEYGKVRAEAYDVVINGVEIGGGSIRIHEQDLQARIFEVLGITPDKQQLLFSHLLKAFSFGAPPHGGIALGVDRLAMQVCGTDNIRDVIAFPKNSKGQDLLMGSPSSVDARQLREVSIQSTKKV